MNKIAAIGDSDSLFAYEIIGADIFAIENKDSKKLLQYAVKSDYSIILLTQPIFRNLQEYIEKLNIPATMSIIPVPSVRSNSNEFCDRTDYFIKRALGNQAV